MIQGRRNETLYAPKKKPYPLIKFLLREALAGSHVRQRPFSGTKQPVALLRLARQHISEFKIC